MALLLCSESVDGICGLGLGVLYLDGLKEESIDGMVLVDKLLRMLKRFEMSILNATKQ